MSTYIIFARWVNLFLVIGGIVLAHLLARKQKNFLLGVPILVWLFQVLIFYLVFFGYYYNILLFDPTVIDHLFSYWATFSRMLALITFYIYFYYMQSTCWRGNKKWM